MNNLTQTQLDAKQAYLNRQQEQMLAQYQNADQTERRAIIRQIDSFLPITRSRDEKISGLSFGETRNIERKTGKIKC